MKLTIVGEASYQSEFIYEEVFIFKSINEPDLSHLQAPCTHSSPLYKDTGW